MTVYDRVLINATAQPNVEGYGQTITILANVTYGVTIDTIFANNNRYYQNY